MPLRSRYILLICFCLLFFSSVRAANYPYAYRRTNVYQTSRSINPVEWQKLTADKEFKYKNDVEKQEPKKDETPKWLEKALIALGNFWALLVNSAVLWIILGAIAIFVIYKLLVINNSIIFRGGRKKIQNTNDTGEAEDIGATNWDALLQKAVENNELQLAVRYSYMWLLQMLQEEQLIKYRTDKTNFEYYRELENTPYKQPFKSLSREYEYAYYGNYAITTGAYNTYIELFNKVRKQIKRS